MLVKRHDEPVDDAQVQDFLRTHLFGQIIAPGRHREFPIVVPTHYAYDPGEGRIVTHFARQNPVWDALREHPRALFTVIGDYVYVPTHVNASEDEPREWGVPTSYYATVQMECDARVIDAPDELAAILQRQLGALQPEGGHHPVTPGDNPYARQFSAIAAVELTIRHTRAKFKFGGNKTPDHRQRIAQHLATRDGPMDAEAREHLLRTLARRKS